MNVMITSRCNMRCMHCCFSCTSKGADMTLALFKQVVDLAVAAGDNVCIGGGEPTLHPLLIDMIRYTVKAYNNHNSADRVGMISNGTCPEDLWKQLMRFRRLDLSISDDIFHDRRRVQPWVRIWAEKNQVWWDQGDYYVITLTGRAVRNRKAIERRCKSKGCDVDFVEADYGFVRVDPNGNVYAEDGDHYAFGPIDAYTANLAYRAIKDSDGAERLLKCYVKEARG